MSVYVDPLEDYSALVSRGPSVWCHMMADSEEELFDMARAIGLKREWYQNHNPRFPHFDLTTYMRGRAIKAGALQVSHKEMIEHFRKDSKHGNDTDHQSQP